MTDDDAFEADLADLDPAEILRVLLAQPRPRLEALLKDVMRAQAELGQPRPGRRSEWSEVVVTTTPTSDKVDELVEIARDKDPKAAYGYLQRLVDLIMVVMMLTGAPGPLEDIDWPSIDFHATRTTTTTTTTSTTVEQAEGEAGQLEELGAGEGRRRGRGCGHAFWIDEPSRSLETVTRLPPARVIPGQHRRPRLGL